MSKKKTKEIRQDNKGRNLRIGESQRKDGRYTYFYELPNITPHILRHTFCIKFANAGMNPKSLQYIMGHANNNMTLNYYTHTTGVSGIKRIYSLYSARREVYSPFETEEVCRYL